MKQTNRLKIDDQSGFAALIIAIVLVIVLSLLTVGFAELMRHSQEQELDRHLSNQAYYAAESGVNDAIRALNHGFQDEKSSCEPLPASDHRSGADYLKDPTVNTDDGSVASWTCLLIDPSPSSLEYDSVDTVTPTTFIFHPANTNDNYTNLNKIEIYWQDASKDNTNFRGGPGGCGNGTSHSFPEASNWCAIGVLRVGLTRLPSSTSRNSASPPPSFNRRDLFDNTYTAFLYPCYISTCTSGTGSFSGNMGFSPNSGSILDGGCSADPDPDNNTATPPPPRYCHVTINIGWPFNSGPNNAFLVNLRSIYSNTSVYIEGYNGGSNPVSFEGAQGLIDSTGKSQNVLKRIQVRIPNRNRYPYPGFDVNTTGGVCKKLSAYPGSVNLSC